MVGNLRERIFGYINNISMYPMEVVKMGAEVLEKAGRLLDPCDPNYEKVCEDTLCLLRSKVLRHYPWILKIISEANLNKIIENAMKDEAVSSTTLEELWNDIAGNIYMNIEEALEGHSISRYFGDSDVLISRAINNVYQYTHKTSTDCGVKDICSFRNKKNGKGEHPCFLLKYFPEIFQPKASS